MRFSQRKTKREMAISAAMLDSTAAQVLMLSEDACLTEAEAAELAEIAGELRGISGDLFAKSLSPREQTVRGIAQEYSAPDSQRVAP